MNDTVLATLLAAVLAGLGGLLVPALIARVPEPPAKPAPEPEDGAEDDADAGSAVEAAEPQPPKTLYVDIAARSGLARRSVVVAGVCGALLGAATGFDWPLLWLVPLTPVAVALSVIDWHTRLLPRIVVVPATLAAILLVVVVGLATGERDAMVRALVCMLLARSFFWVLWWLRSAGMGFGDVRLAAPIGLVLGWAGTDAVVLGLWFGFISFALPALGLAVVRRDRAMMKKSFPFGPFMVFGALVGLVWGTAIGWPLSS